LPAEGMRETAPLRGEPLPCWIGRRSPTLPGGGDLLGGGRRLLFGDWPAVRFASRTSRAATDPTAHPAFASAVGTTKRSRRYTSRRRSRFPSRAGRSPRSARWCPDSRLAPKGRTGGRRRHHGHQSSSPCPRRGGARDPGMPRSHGRRRCRNRAIAKRPICAGTPSVEEASRRWRGTAVWTRVRMSYPYSASMNRGLAQVAVVEGRSRREAVGEEERTKERETGVGGQSREDKRKQKRKGRKRSGRSGRPARWRQRGSGWF
jgi:hypothetical protein